MILKTLTTTVALAALLTAAVISTPVSGKVMMRPPVMNKMSTIAAGKAISTSARCTGCHNSQLQGRPGFSPSLHPSGVLKEYTKKSFERVMNTGVTPDGTLVKKPMPIYHFPAAKSDMLYAYLKTLR